MAEKIVFICTGNTCRSPMAAYIASYVAERKYPRANFMFDSAGLFAAENVPATAEAKDVLSKHGIDMSKHRSKMFKEPMVEKADILITMTQGHKRALLEAYPRAEAKTFTLGELSGSNNDVHDPYCGSREVYEKTASVLRREIEIVLDKAAKGLLPV
ncbi:MAG: low molecular weight protein arginine phosphatase [Bacillota bacterium]|nr:low molecular weight protein arginine phosphatase [Bacillota bacterium]